jgi:hypothetical protein
MRTIILLVVVLAALAGCTAKPLPEGDPPWWRDDPARRVYGGGQ